MDTNKQSIAQHYEQLLNLTEPWAVSDVDLNTEKLQLTIKVATRKGAKLPCPKCGKLCPKEDHREERIWRHLDTMQFKTIISCNIPRIKCLEHGVKSVKIPWAEEYSRFTLLFEKFAIDVIQASQSITSAKELLKISWDQIHEIQKRAVERGLERRKDETIKYAGVDEKSFLKCHSYASLLTDLDQGRVLDVIEGRTEESAKSLLNTLSENQKKSIEAMSMDFWVPFMNAAKDIIPNAEIVHDKYHAAAYLGKAVDSVRKKENNSLLKSGDDSLKGTKYLWLTNLENLSKDARKTFRSLALDELKVGRAWSIKESFKHFWSYKYQGSAINFFKNWYYWATHSKLKPVIEAAKTLKRHFAGLITYLKHHITNATTEGLNSKIQSIKSNARGFRNFQNYRISILFHCGKLSLYP